MKTLTDRAYQALLAVLFGAVLGAVVLLCGKETIRDYRQLDPAPTAPADTVRSMQREIDSLREDNAEIRMALAKLSPTHGLLLGDSVAVPPVASHHPSPHTPD